MTTSRHLLLIAATAATVATLAVAGCGGPADTTANPASPAAATAATPAPPATPTGKRVEFRVVGGQVQGGLARVDVPLGTPVTLVVTSDEADEAHLHGYDRSVELSPGTPGTITFTADNPGVFEFELHHADAQLARIEVR